MKQEACVRRLSKSAVIQLEFSGHPVSQNGFARSMEMDSVSIKQDTGFHGSSTL